MITPSLPTERFSKNVQPGEIKITEFDIQSLREIVGDEWVNNSIEVLMNYSMDMSEQVAPVYMK